jgi:Icc-related predicted phosphoesterase
MKRFLSKLILFSSVFILIYPFLIGVLGSYWLTQRRLTRNLVFYQGGNSFIWSKFEEADTIKNIDLLIVGSSLANKGIDPRNFEKIGYRTFNLGSNAQTPQQTEYLLNKYLDEFNPEIVIWEVTPETFEYKGVESFIDIISNSEINWSLVKQGFSYFNLIPINTMIISSWKQYNGNFYDYIERDIKGGNLYVSGGYVESTNTEFIMDEGDRKKKFSFLNDQKKSFERSLENLKNRGIKVFLVGAPTTNKYFLSIENWDEVFLYFESFMLKGFIQDYINFNKLYSDFGNELKLFNDKMHLNKNGVNKYNLILIDELDL